MIDQTIQRAQVYYFLSQVLLYPQDNWLDDAPLLEKILQDLDIPTDGGIGAPFAEQSLESLQADYRQVFGLTGSLVYETELGLPHEFRQSQELADIAGFYRAFGFENGGAVRERPDHVATELEFMYLLSLKEAHASSNSMPEQAEICIDAQREFLQDHLGRWIGPFCRSLEHSIDERLGQQALGSPYVKLAHLAERFISAEVDRLGAIPAVRLPAEGKPTPYNPDYSCAGCAVAEPNM